MDRQTDRQLNFFETLLTGAGSSSGRSVPDGRPRRTDERTDGRRERARGETGEGTDDRSVGRNRRRSREDGRTDGRARVDRFVDLDLDCVALTPLRRRRRHVSSIERADKTGAGL